MYPDPFNTTRPYTGQSPFDAPCCPVCGAANFDCPDTATVPTPLAPFDIAGEAESTTGQPLRRYTVTAYGFTSVMQLNDTDAARYGDAAVLIT